MRTILRISKLSIEYFHNCQDDIKTNQITQRRGTILEMGQDGADSTVTAEVPVADMFGFSSDIRGSTQGRAIWSIENAGFKQLMPDLQKKVVAEIRTRKGMNPEPYDSKYYSGM